MTAKSQTAGGKGSALYAEAERALWDHYGLTPIENQVDIGGRLIRLHEVGSGPPILFIHGTGGSGVYWAPLAAELKGQYRCLLVDRPGWAETSPVDYTQPGFANVVVMVVDGLLDGLGVEQARIVGGSVGGIFALRYALARPDRVVSFVQMGAAPVSLLEIGDAGMHVPPPQFIRLLRSPLGKLMVRIPQREAMVRKQLAGLGHGASLETDSIPSEFIHYYFAMSRYTQSLKSERDLVRAILRSDGWVTDLTLNDKEREMLTLPTLMILGDQDPIGSVAAWRMFTDTLPNAQLGLIPGGGHLPWYDNPALVAQLVQSHFSDHPRIRGD